jgi:hypothetical protein
MFTDENTPDLVQDDTNNEEVEVVEEVEEAPAEDKDWKAEALKFKAILDRNAKKEKEEPKHKSDELGLDVKGYLKASGIKAAEFDFVKAELKASGQDIDSLLENEYFQAKLEKHRELSKTAEATPTGKRSGGVAIDSVDYWMTKPIEEVPQDMRIKVVNAKLGKDQNKGVFYNS